MADRLFSKTDDEMTSFKDMQFQKLEKMQQFGIKGSISVEVNFVCSENMLLFK